MAIRGTVTVECDSKGCHAELVIGDLEFNVAPQRGGGLELSASAPEWVEDDEGLLVCPDCVEKAINGREKGEDDGREYGHPGDRLRGID